jgi:hypothetical protein
MNDLASGAGAGIAAHVAHTCYEDLAPAVIHAFKRALLDAVLHFDRADGTAQLLRYL